MTKQLKLLKKRLENGKERTYEEILEDLRNRVDVLAAEFIPELCTALKRKNPLMSSVTIRATVIADCAKQNGGPWKESTIRQFWPDWMKNPKSVQAGHIAGNSIGAGRPRKIPLSNKGISQEEQDDLDQLEESRPVKSWTPDEYEEEHPEIAESPFEAIGEINRKLASFWTALTKQKNMPTSEDDVMKQYIIPARTRLKDMLNGSSKTERVYLFNWLTWIIMAAKDCRDLCEKADATAYDTR